MTINKLIFTPIFCLALITSFSGKAQTNPEGINPLKVESQSSKIVSKTYKLKDFKQSCCAGIINYSLEEVEGFVKSETNVKEQQITVWYDSNKCTEKAIKKAINQTPYKIIEKKITRGK